MSARSDLYLVIMAGGSGTRFWPKSTSYKPKQLLAFGKDPCSLLSQTLARFDGLVDPEKKWVVTTRGLQNAIRSDAPGVRILAEPQARNTSPCIYWAAREVARHDPRAVMLVMPADHYIADPGPFSETLKRAIARARKNDELVTLGIRPSRPETGYGYLKAAAEEESDGSRKVEAFVEKPDHEKAKHYLEEGNYLWNGGMFIWRAEVILGAFDRFMPEMKRAWENSGGKIEAAYPEMTATSVDYGVMEKAPNVVTFPLDCGWDDLGSWTSLESLAGLLGAGQAGGTVAAGEVLAIESTGNIIDVPGKLVALLGAKNLIIVEASGALLVADKSRAQEIRRIVDEVKKIRPELA